jgi:hypothetical protein
MRFQVDTVDLRAWREWRCPGRSSGARKLRVSIFGETIAAYCKSGHDCIKVVPECLPRY